MPAYFEFQCPMRPLSTSLPRRHFKHTDDLPQRRRPIPCRASLAPRLAALFAARTLQHDGSARDRATTWKALYGHHNMRPSACAVRDAAVPCRPRRLHPLLRTPIFFSSVPPSSLEAPTCRAPRYHRYNLLRLQHGPWLFPIASAAFIPSSRLQQAGLYPSIRAFPLISNTTHTTPDVLST
ncbi:hypothetical protein K438DRAFT_1989881 [Mycena galopus ATCC 62051]|nr:hypothetical protein K438DRAFT_1989881 [Mycena galopus ATCC 62051]